ncbi:MAG: DUF3179 domain-containing protein [Phyllobacteriaceae bacterium]|nr:DUF3179 domain-containing protein [Phyllobacteriaceae bacterium]
MLLAALAFGAITSSAQANPDEWRAQWPTTDFARSAIDFAEVMSGGPPKDGIPAIMEPTFVSVADETRLGDREPVLLYIGPSGEARAYPIRYLMWHEIVNDTVDGTPLAVTFCPLCNTAMVFDARLDGSALTFGVSGMLRHSDMIMYDHQSESWWQQATGEAIVGAKTGSRLTQLPSRLVSWAEFAAAHPRGLVMDEPMMRRAYGANPYQNYDTGRPFLYTGENPPRGINPVERVVRVGDRAWPLTRLTAEKRISEAGLTLTWNQGQASALDTAEIAKGREIGTVRVVDAGGKNVVHDMPFAFAFHAFHPDGTWMITPAAKSP